MKIVMICDFFSETLEYQENLLLKYYVKHGHDVTILASTFDSVFDYYAGRYDSKRPRREYEFAGGKVIRLPYKFFILKRLRAYADVLNILVKECPDLIYVHDIHLNLLQCVTYVCLMPKCKMIMDFHADLSNSGRNWVSRVILHGVIRKWVLDKARPHLSRIFPVVPASLEFLRDTYKVPIEVMEILPLGADVELGCQVTASNARERLRQRYGLDGQDVVIFSGGKLEPLKRTESLVDAVLSLADLRLHLVIVGDASHVNHNYRNMLSERAAGASNIHFTGWLDNVGLFEHLDMSDFAVFPASQSILWQQAISMGLPLIVGDKGHTGESRQDVSYLNFESNILILDDQQPIVKELSRNIALLACDRALRQRMSDGARRVSQRTLDWNVLIERTLRFGPSAT